MGKTAQTSNQKEGLKKMIRLVVWITLPSGERVLCGEIVCNDPQTSGKLAGAFRYTPEWINHADGFALDPNALPLTNAEYVCDLPQGIFSVFEDSLPDDWGRRLLIRRAKLNRGQQNLANLLLALNGAALGALSYFPEEIKPVQRHFASILELETLVDAALGYEAGKKLGHSELRLLFVAATSPGGARPKSLLRTDEGNHWIAKFPSFKDEVSMIPIEAATMALAQKAGLSVPEFRIEQCGKYKVLLVKRFDISPRGGRRHMISFQTLMQVTGYYTLGYLDLFETLRRFSDKPATDLPALFRQMVFNALIGNTDDHLKNFSLLHDESGFYLSPAYDLVPDTADRREHVLHFSPDFYFPGTRSLARLGRRAQISGPESIVAEVRSVVNGWRDEFERWKVPRADIERLSQSIDDRLR